jgi:hypothetical protein
MRRLAEEIQAMYMKTDVNRKQRGDKVEAPIQKSDLF